MLMPVPFVCYIMIMPMCVNDFVRVRTSVVGVGQEVVMLVDVTADDGIGHGKNRPGNQSGPLGLFTCKSRW